MTAPDFHTLACQGDAEADQRVAEFAGSGEDAIQRVSNMLHELLAWRPEAGRAPEALREEIEARLVLPAWVAEGGGQERIARAQQVFAEREVAHFMVLGFASLPACYRQPQIAQMLTASGRLAAQVFRRLRETADFVAGVSTPGAFAADGLGPAWCRKVRFTHAAMRYLALRDASAEAAPSGRELQDFLLNLQREPGDPQPIDQTELAYVLQTFGYLNVQGMRDLRIRLSQAEAEDHLFLWSVVGDQIGITEELLPRPQPGGESLEQQARRIFDTIDAWNHRTQDVTEDGRLLTATLVVSMRRAMLRAVPRLVVVRRLVGPYHPLRLVPPAALRWLDGEVAGVVSSAPRSFVRFFLGRQMARDLGLDPAPLLHTMGHVFAFALAGHVPRSAAESWRGVGGAPLDWARTPVGSLRRSAVLRMGARIRRWECLEPPSSRRLGPRLATAAGREPAMSRTTDATEAEVRPDPGKPRVEPDVRSPVKP